jgi:hypothetical protein
MACGVVGATRCDGSGRVVGPPRGVRPVPGVRISGVFLLPGVGPALTARWKGVLGWWRALGVVASMESGDVRCFFRAESDMAAAGPVSNARNGCVDGLWGNAPKGRAFLVPRLR